jgi:hypothetical protein
MPIRPRAPKRRLSRDVGYLMIGLQESPEVRARCLRTMEDIAVKYARHVHAKGPKSCLRFMRQFGMTAAEMRHILGD